MPVRKEFGRNAAAAMLVWWALPALAAEPPIMLPAHTTIAAEGDSLTYGQDTSPAGVRTAINGATARRSAFPYPETLQELLPECGRVANHGFPGDQSLDGLLRWRKEPPAGLTILMYGSNDVLNFGNAARGRVDVATYRQTLSALVERRRQRGGGQTIILAPPPLQEKMLDVQLEPYRQAARTVAELTGSRFVDTAAVLRPVAGVWTDGVHLSAAANRAISGHLAAMIACGGPAGRD